MAKINVDGLAITIKPVEGQDYISLTDIAKQRNPDRPRDVIRAWLGNQNTEEFLTLWESIYNPHFKRDHFAAFKNYFQRKKSNPQVKEFIQETGSVGIISKSGRYGGTFAHRDIAFEFASWLSPSFKLRVIIDYQRLKSKEYEQAHLEWDAGRFLSKVNYQLQTTAIKETLEPKEDKFSKSRIYANEADLLNHVVFGMTAKQWRKTYPHAKGNMRDQATLIDNIILANMESLNAGLIEAGVSYENREKHLVESASRQRGQFEQDKRLQNQNQDKFTPN